MKSAGMLSFVGLFVGIDSRVDHGLILKKSPQNYVVDSSQVRLDAKQQKVISFNLALQIPWDELQVRM